MFKEPFIQSYLYKQWNFMRTRTPINMRGIRDRALLSFPPPHTTFDWYRSVRRPTPQRIVQLEFRGARLTAAAVGKSPTTLADDSGAASTPSGCESPGIWRRNKLGVIFNASIGRTLPINVELSGISPLREMRELRMAGATLCCAHTGERCSSLYASMRGLLDFR